MSTKRLNIDILARDKTGQAFKSVQRETKKTTQTLFSLKNVLFAVAGSVVVRQTLELANTFQNLQNRLKLVTDSASELASVQQELFEVSQRTRGGFAETVELYQKLALQSQSLGLQTSELSQITENVNKVIAIAGVNSVQASAGILQLSQAFASGRLQGDEFRSISENIPPLLNIFAKELGVTRGELKKLGSEGKITSEVIATALLKETENINEAFSQLSPTIGQASTTVGNSFLNLVGKFTQVTGASDLLAESLIVVSNELDKISNTIDIFSGVQLKDVDKAFEENENSIKDVIKTTSELDNVLKQIALVRNTDILGVNTLSGSYEELEQALLEYRKELEKVNDEQEDDSPVKSLDSFLSKNKETYKKISDSTSDFFKTEIEKLRENKEKELKVVANAQKDIQEQLQAFKNGELNITDETHKKLLQRENELGRLKQGIKAKYETQITQIEKDELEKRKEENLKIFNEIGEKFDEHFEKMNETMMKQRSIIEILQDKYSDFNKDFNANLEIANALTDAFVDLKKGIGDAVAQSIIFGKSFKESFGNVARQALAQLVSTLVQVGVQILANQIISRLGLKSAEKNTSESMKKIAADATPAATAVSLATAGSNAFGAIAGTLATFAVTKAITARQNGGPVFEGQPYVVGENGREMFVPSQDGTIVSNRDMNKGTVVNINITANDTTDFDKLLVKRRGLIVGLINNALNEKGQGALV